ncbi:MAG: hypothetical protein U0796_03880 [Gemmatales bacterium]
MASQLFPREKLQLAQDGSLFNTSPPEDELLIGCFPGITIVAAAELGIDYPSTLPAHFLKAGGVGVVYLHAMHSVVDWFAFAIWQKGKLQRSLSLSPDSGILEDIGAKLPFEEPYWAGEHPAIDPEDDDEDDPYPFPFHPLELGEAALHALFGYQIEGGKAPDYDPETVPLMTYQRK